MLCNELKKSEYKVYWLKGYPLINSWACTKKYWLSFKRETNIYQEKLVNIELGNKGGHLRCEDILVGHPYNYNDSVMSVWIEYLLSLRPN